MDDIKNVIEALYPMNRYLLGADYNSGMKLLEELLDLEIIDIPSGTKLETWTVPQEWVVREAWVKDPKGKKIIDFKKDPLAIKVGSKPFKGKVTEKELAKHLNYSDGMPEAVPYSMEFYEDEWGFNVRKNKFFKQNKEVMAGVKLENGEEFVPRQVSTLKKGEYEVCIDSEKKDGAVRIGVHTIKGKSDREILLFAHLDHPFQANDNLSGIGCLLNVVKKIKADHTIKIIFCPETIGSIAYGETQDISKVDFMLAVDICGNNGQHVLQFSFDNNRVNAAFNLALREQGQNYQLGKFRTAIGSDEYYFNDPKVGIPGLMITRFPFKEYHTSEDTPDKLDYQKIEETADVIIKGIEIYEKDFIPTRNFKGPLMRQGYGIQTVDKKTNLSWDYLFYAMDGKLSLAELCVSFGMAWGVIEDVFNKLEKDEKISRVNPSTEQK